MTSTDIVVPAPVLRNLLAFAATDAARPHLSCVAFLKGGARIVGCDGHTLLVYDTAQLRHCGVDIVVPDLPRDLLFERGPLDLLVSTIHRNKLGRARVSITISATGSYAAQLIEPKVGGHLPSGLYARLKETGLDYPPIDQVIIPAGPIGSFAIDGRYAIRVATAADLEGRLDNQHASDDVPRFAAVLAGTDNGPNNFPGPTRWEIRGVSESKGGALVGIAIVMPIRIGP